MEFQSNESRTAQEEAPEYGWTDLRSESRKDDVATGSDWAAISNDWANRKVALSREWSLLTDEDVEGIDGNRRSLQERLQERYAWTAEEAASQIEQWLNAAGKRRYV